MANQCSILCTIDFPTNTDAVKFCSEISRLLEQARDEGYDSLFFGGGRYFFDVHESVDDNSVNLNGWVKWMLEPEDAGKWVTYIQCKVRELRLTYDNITIQYEECGYKHYGRYDSTGKTIMHIYVAESDWPDPESRSLYQDLDTILSSSKSIIQEVTYR